MVGPSLGAEGVLPLISAVCLVLVGGYAIVAWRRFRTTPLAWFAGGVFAAALFAASSVSMGLGVDAPTEALCSRVTMFSGGLHGALWIGFLASQSGHPPTRTDWHLAAACAVVGLLSLVPGLVISGAVFERAAWFGMRYRDSVPTPLGRVFAGLYSVGLLYLDARTYELWRRGAPGAPSQLAASGLLTLTGLNDMLAFAGLTRAPYLNDIGLLALVLGVGASFVDLHTRSLQALEVVRSDLGAAREALVRRERLAALGELSAVVAHEVRNPVAVIFNALPMLKRSLPAEAGPSRALAEIIGEEADRIRRIVDELLDFVRPIELRRDAVDLAALLSSVVPASEGEAEQAVSVEVGPGAESVQADAHLLGLALSNLLRNALQSGSPRDGIRVLCRAEAARVHLAVIDRGPGVPEASVGRLFEPFFTTRPTGTGLGLAFVQRVAEAHGGAVAYEPTPGGGATFTVSLPRA